MEKLIKIYQEERPWGYFRQFTKNEETTVKIIVVNSGEQLSLQSHERRGEFWKITKGSGLVEIGDEKKDASIGDEFIILKGQKHRITAGAEGAEFIEISFGDFEEGDIVRYEDKYNRV